MLTRAWIPGSKALRREAGQTTEAVHPDPDHHLPVFLAICQARFDRAFFKKKTVPFPKRFHKSINPVHFLHCKCLSWVKVMRRFHV